MPNPSEDSLIELDDILREGDGNKKAFNDFFRRKAALSRPHKQSVFGGFDMNLDIDVKFAKRDKPKGPSELPVLPQAVRSPLRNFNQNVNLRASDAAPASTAPTGANGLVQQSPMRAAFKSVSQSPVNVPPPRRSISLSPNPGRSPLNNAHRSRLPSHRSSDRLRRSAIRRQSNGRRQLLKQFDTLCSVPRSSSSPCSFQPQVSSTPASQPRQAQETVVPSEADKIADGRGTKIAHLRQRFENSFQNNVIQLENGDGGSLLTRPVSWLTQHSNSRPDSVSSQNTQSRPVTPVSQRLGTSKSANSRTYTIEKGPMPGQLVLSPRQPIVRLSRTNLQTQSKEILVPNTPVRVISSQAELYNEPEIIVPETQPLENAALSETERLIHNLSCSTNRPIMVIPISCQAPAAAVSTPLEVEQNVMQCTNKSIQTSSSRVAPVNNDIMTDDESNDSEPGRVVGNGSAVLDLAPPGGNTTRQLQRNKTKAPNHESSMQLLNLHKGVQEIRQQTQQKVPLNKPPNIPINGEQFASELARMSNYEILDLRKRNSMGLVYPINGHIPQCNSELNIQKEQRISLEKSIYREIIKRNLNGNSESLPITASESALCSDEKVDSSIQEISLKSLPSKRGSKKTIELPNGAATSPISSNGEVDRSKRPSRSRRRNVPMTKELESYITLSQTIEGRRYTRGNIKRSLYTKGESMEEISDCPSPEKLVCLNKRSTRSSSNLVRCTSVGDIAIVPPPPRYSRSNLNSPLGSSDNEMDQLIVNPPSAFAGRSNYVNDEENTQTFAAQSLGTCKSGPSQQDSMHSTQDEMDELLIGPALSSKSRLQSMRITDDEIEEPSSAPVRSSRSRKLSMNTAHDEVDQLSSTHQRSSKSRQHSMRITDDEVEEPSTAPVRSFRSRSRKISMQTTDEVSSAPVQSSKSRHISMRTSDNEEEDPDMPNKDYETEEPFQASIALPEECAQYTELASEEIMPTPPTQFRSSTKKNSNKKPKSADVDAEMPSTSRQAKLRLAETESVFKKPLAPAPRRRGRPKNNTKLNTELSRLKNTLTNESRVVIDSNAEEDGSIRRSKRGHIPIQNTWVHTVSDPNKFQFFGWNLSSNRVKSKQLQKPQREKRKQQEHPEADSLAVPRTPLCSSTPLNAGLSDLPANHVSTTGKRKRHQQDTGYDAEPESNGLGQTDLQTGSFTSGIEPLSQLDILQEEIAPQTTKKQTKTKNKPKAEVKKTGRKKKTQVNKEVNQIEQQTAEEHIDCEHPAEQQLEHLQQEQQQLEQQQQEQVQMEQQQQEQVQMEQQQQEQQMEQFQLETIQEQTENFQDAATLPRVDSTASTSSALALTQAQNSSTPLMDWLRGVSDTQPGSEIDCGTKEFKSMHLSSVSNLYFSNVDDNDFAFYNTEPKAIMGYIRLKPLHKRRGKRVKLMNLYYVVLHGKIEISTMGPDTNEWERTILSHGDMVKIDTGARYTIENLMDEMCVLFFFRKEASPQSAQL